MTGAGARKIPEEVALEREVKALSPAMRGARVRIYWLKSWEHPAEFGPRWGVAVLTLAKWDFGFVASKPGGAWYVDIYFGARGVQVDFERDG